jgi:hypothetical protein
MQPLWQEFGNDWCSRTQFEDHLEKKGLDFRQCWAEKYMGGLNEGQLVEEVSYPKESGAGFAV